MIDLFNKDDFPIDDEIDELCDRFENEMNQGETPNLHLYLTKIDNRKRKTLFVELLKIEWELGQKLIGPHELETYLHQFPNYQGIITELYRSRQKENVVYRLCCPNCRNEVTIVQSRSKSQSEIKCTHCQTLIHVLGNQVNSEDLLSEGVFINQYQLIETVGHGSFGTVWKARDTHLQRDVAIKIPRGSEINQEVLLKMLDEARAAASLAHPNIVSVYEVQLQKDPFYIASEFIEGITLRDKIKSDQLSFDQIAEICLKIAQALQYTHDHQVIHRDIKPSNILLDRLDRPKIADFGLAKRDATQITMTMTGYLVGTPAYMSPEQCQLESGNIDHRTDIYSLGVLLYEMLTGKLPILGDIDSLRERVVNHEPTSPRLINPAIPRDLETICLKCLEKKPINRFESPHNLAEELTRYLKNEPIHSRPISQYEHLRRWVEKHPYYAGMISLIASLLILISITSVAFYIRESVLKEIANQAKIKAENVAAENLELAKREENTRKKMEAEWYSNNIIRASTILKEKQPAAAWEQIKKLPLSIRTVEADYLVRRCHNTPLIKHLEVPGDDVISMAVSPVSDWIATSNGNSTIHVWKTNDLSLVTKIKTNHQKITRLKFDPSGKFIASGDQKGMVLIHELITNNQVYQWQYHRPIGVLKYSNDGSLLAVCDEQIHLIDLSENISTTLKSKNDKRYLDLAISLKQGTLVALNGQGNIDFWNLNNKKIDVSMPLGYKNNLNQMDLIDRIKFRKVDALCISPDEEYIIIAGGSKIGIRSKLDDPFILVDIKSRTIKSVVNNSSQGTNYIVFHPDGQQYVTYGQKTPILLWNLLEDRPERIIETTAEYLTHLDFSYDGSQLIGLDRDGVLRIWNLTAHHKIDLPFYPTISQSKLSSDCSYLVTAADSTITVYDSDTKRVIFQEIIKNSDKQIIAISPLGNSLAFIDELGHLRINSGRLFQKQTTIKLKHALKFLAFSHDGKTLNYVTENSNRVISFNLTTKKNYERIGNPVTDELLTLEEKDYMLESSQDRFYQNDNLSIKNWQLGTHDLFLREINSGKQFRLGEIVGSPAIACNHSISNKIAVATNEREIKVWTVNHTTASTSLVKSLNLNSQPLSLCFDLSGNILLVADDAGNIQFIDLRSKNEAFSLKINRSIIGSITELRCSNDNVFYACGNRGLSILDSSIAEQTQILGNHTGRIAKATFDPSYKKVLCMTDSGMLSLWDLRLGQSIFSISHSSFSAKQQIGFDSSGSKIVVISENESTLWDSSTGQNIPWNEKHNGDSLFFNYTNTETGIRLIPVRNQVQVVKYYPVIWEKNFSNSILSKTGIYRVQLFDAVEKKNIYAVQFYLRLLIQSQKRNLDAGNMPETNFFSLTRIPEIATYFSPDFFDSLNEPDKQLWETISREIDDLKMETKKKYNFEQTAPKNPILPRKLTEEEIFNTNQAKENYEKALKEYQEFIEKYKDQLLTE